MFEKVSKYHPDKIADRIAGATVDLAYEKDPLSPRIATEVLIGHGYCHVIIETTVGIKADEVVDIINRISPNRVVSDVKIYPQDKELSDNQIRGIRAGDNGIFKGSPITKEQVFTSHVIKMIDDKLGSDGKYIVDIDNGDIIICQSNIESEDMLDFMKNLGYDFFENIKINPLGYWTGGTDVDVGCTNRKLGSDLGNGVTGGGLIGKDLSKADVSVNIYLSVLANAIGCDVEASCAIGDSHIFINGELIPYQEVVEVARNEVKEIGGFEKLAEYGLIR